MAIDPAATVTNRADGLKAVMFLSGIPVDQISGYILLTYPAEGKMRIDGTVCCYAHLTGLLADAVAEMAVDLADEHAIMLST